MKQLSIEELKLMRDLQENVENHAMVQALDELIAIRELKGEQVPVAYLYMGDAMEWKNVQLAEDTDEGQAENCIPLFTAPQKPVVLPKEIEPYEVKTILDPTANVDEYSECVGADMWNAAIKASRMAIEAASGLVKDNSTDNIGDKNV